MIKNSIRNEKVVEISFFLSLILVFLDSYEFMKLPLTWIGNFMIVAVCIFIFYKEKMQINSLVLLILFITLIPTIFNLFTFDFLSSQIVYTITRVASYFGFVITFKLAVSPCFKVTVSSAKPSLIA